MRKNRQMQINEFVRVLSTCTFLTERIPDIAINPVDDCSEDGANPYEMEHPVRLQTPSLGL